MKKQTMILVIGGVLLLGGVAYAATRPPVRPPVGTAPPSVDSKCGTAVKTGGAIGTTAPDPRIQLTGAALMAGSSVVCAAGAKALNVLKSAPGGLATAAVFPAVALTVKPAQFVTGKIASGASTVFHKLTPW